MKYGLLINVEGDYRPAGSDLSYEMAHRLAGRLAEEGTDVRVVQVSHRRGIDPCICCQSKDGALISNLGNAD